MTSASARRIATVLLAVYLLVLLALTLLPDAGSNRGGDIRFHLEPFRTIGIAFRQGLRSHEWRVLVGNLAAFVPLGVLLPAAVPRLSLARLAVVAALLSTAIELGQLAISLYLASDYRTADIDDVLVNVVGAIAGMLLFTAIRLLLGGRQSPDAT